MEICAHVKEVQSHLINRCLREFIGFCANLNSDSFLLQRKCVFTAVVITPKLIPFVILE